MAYIISVEYFVYIVRCIDDTLYCGKTTNVEKRLRAHNGVIKGGAKYTSGRRPVELVYLEQLKTVTEALKREYFLKQLTKEEKVKLISVESDSEIVKRK